MPLADGYDDAVCFAVEVSVALAEEVTDSFTLALANGVALSVAVAERLAIADVPEPCAITESDAVEVTVALAEPLAVGL